jgi:hypothetical protein
MVAFRFIPDEENERENGCHDAGHNPNGEEIDAP